MKKPSWLAIALAGVASIGAAQTSPAPQPTSAAGQSGLSPSAVNGLGMQLSTGVVTEYKPGERIGVRVADDNIITLDLERNVRVDGLVAVGRLAAVMWVGEGGGKRRATSITAAPGPGNAGVANLQSGYKKMSEEAPGARGAVTPGPSTTGAPTILTPKTRSTTKLGTTSTPGRPPTPTPTP